jgi:hypothetical protein
MAKSLLIHSSLFLLALSFASEVSASDPGRNTRTPEDTAAGTTTVGRTMVDRSYESVDNVVQAAVRRVDGFFVNEEHATFSDKKTRIRLRLDTDYLQHAGWDLSPRVKLHLVLPGLNDRLRIVMNDDEGTETDQSATDDQENDLALRWIGRQSAKRGYSFDLGLRLKGGSLDPFARMNAGFEYELPGKWVGQSTNRLYYYSRTGLRNDFRQYFNHGLTDDLLFRSRTRVQYFEENVSNPYIEQKFSVFHSHRENRKLAYEVLYRKVSIEDSPFDEDEILASDADYFNHYQAQIRIRQQAWRPWFFVEFWPIVGWPEERDYQTTLAARIRLEVNLGGSGDRRLDE